METVEAIARAGPQNAFAIDEHRAHEIVRESFGKSERLKFSVFETVQSVGCSYPDRAVSIAGTRDGLNSFHDNVFTTYTTRDGLANNFIGAIFEDSKGNLWVGTLGGLNKIHDGQFQTFTTKDGLSSNTVISLYEDASGDLWIGTNGGGLNRFHDGKFVSFTGAADV